MIQNLSYSYIPKYTLSIYSVGKARGDPSGQACAGVGLLIVHPFVLSIADCN